MKSKPKDIEKMIFELFSLCDKTVWIEDWLDFHKSFEKILKKFGYDIYQIYYGRSKKEFMTTKKELYHKWQADQKKKEIRMKKPIVYIKNRPQKTKV